jgi:hypothetical protein
MVIIMVVLIKKWRKAMMTVMIIMWKNNGNEN